MQIYNIIPQLRAVPLVWGLPPFMDGKKKILEEGLVNQSLSLSHTHTPFPLSHAALQYL